MNIRLTSIIAALLLAGASMSNAQDKATLDLLVSKGVITRAEADNISKSAVAIAPKEKTTKSIKLIGRLQMQYENIGLSQTANGNTQALPTQNGFIMRRVFLGMDASLGAGWGTKIVADLTASDLSYMDEAVIYKKVDIDYIKGTAEMGFKKINFGYEENTSSSKLISIERSIATRYFTESNNGRRLGFGGRHTGLFWDGEVTQVEGLGYSVSITNSYNNNPVSIPSTAKSTDLMYAAGVKYSKKIEDVSFLVGANFAYTNSMDVSGTSNHDGAVYGIEPYMTVSAYGFELWSDFMLTNVQDGKNNYTADATPLGLNVGIEYKFDIGEFGKIGPALRYSWIDTDGRGIKASDGIRNAYSGTGTSTYNAGQSVYIGMNWYIIGNSVKFQAGYEWAQFNGTTANSSAAVYSDANAIRAQMQILF